MTPILTAVAAKARDKRLAKLDDDEVTRDIATFDRIVRRYRGFAPTVRDDVEYRRTTREGVLHLPAFTWQIAAVSTIDSRRVHDAVLNSTTAVTSATAAFADADHGRFAIAEGVPTGATVASHASSTAAALSVAATVTATGSVLTIGEEVDPIDADLEAEVGRARMPYVGSLTVSRRHGMLSPPDELLDATTEYVLAMSRYRASGVSRDTISTVSEAGTTRNTMPDWWKGRPTGFTEVDRLLNTLSDLRVGVA